MTIPKEIHLPQRTDFIESLGHPEEYSARELVAHMAGGSIEHWPSGVITLPHNSIRHDEKIPVAPYIELPVGNHELAGLIDEPDDKLDELAPLYGLFDLALDYKPDQQTLGISVAGTNTYVSTEQTFYDYTHPAYLRMIYGLFACFTRDDAQVIEHIHQKGVLISAFDTSTSTALALPGRILNQLDAAILPWQTRYKPDVLYPIDLHEQVYAIADQQGYFNVRKSMDKILSAIQPVGVRVIFDSIANIYVKGPAQE